MLRVFLDVVLPVFIVVAAGGLAGRWQKLPVGPISTLVFYVFSPCLVFHQIATTTVSAGTSVRIIGVMLATYLSMFLASQLWSFVRRHDTPMRAAFALGATTPNSGNMGLPVAQLAFGAAGLQVAIVNFVAGSVLANSAGIAIASMAGGSSLAALRAPFRYPAIYAAALGLAVNVAGIKLPTTIDAPTASLAAAAVPTMLVVLGLQLQNAGGNDNLVDTLAVNLMRLLIAPAVAYGVATLLGLDGVTRGTLVVLAAMPTAVITTILATEFRAIPAFVTRVVVTSTAASILSLTLLITLLQ